MPRLSMFKKLLELGEQNKHVNQWKLVDTTKKMAFDIGKCFVVDKDTYQDKGIIIYDFNDGLLDKFVKDFLTPFRQSYISDEDLESGLMNDVWDKRSEAIGEQIPTTPSLRSGEFSEILLYFLSIHFNCPDANVAPLKWRWKENQDMACHLSDIVLLKCADEKNPSEDDYMYVVESKGRAKVLSYKDKTSVMNAGIDGALKDYVSRAGKMVAYMRSKYNHDHQYALAKKVKRFGNSVDVDYKKSFSAAIVVDRASLKIHVANINPAKLVKAHAKGIALIAVPIDDMRKVYNRMFNEVVNT